MQICILIIRFAVAAVSHVLDLLCHHRPLAFVEVAALEVERGHRTADHRRRSQRILGELLRIQGFHECRCARFCDGRSVFFAHVSDPAGLGDKVATIQELSFFKSTSCSGCCSPFATQSGVSARTEASWALVVTILSAVPPVTQPPRRSRLSLQRPRRRLRPILRALPMLLLAL